MRRKTAPSEVCTELTESLKRAEEDMRKGNVTVCRNGEEIRRHLESL